ncbi:MAG: ABC transporter substrate-binding protein [Thermomicrobiales bacterium]
MDDAKFSQYLSRFQNGRLDRRRLIGGAAAAVAASALAGPARGVMAGPRALPSRQIDAKTIVIADDLRPGAQWITLDPAWIYEINAGLAFVLNYESLYDLPDSTKPAEFTPLLAADFPQVSEDGLEVTIPLRTDIKFHSGNAMTADDVIFSWNRLKNIKYQPSFLATDYWTSVDAVDDHTIKLTLPSPNAALVSILSAQPLAVTDSKLLKENGGTDAEDADKTDTAKDWVNKGNSAGTGPFKLTKWDLGNEVVLERHEGYWGEPSKFDRLIVRNIPDANSQLQAVQTGEADIAYSLDPDVAASVKEDPNLQLISGPSLAIEYIAMHTQEAVGGPLSNKTLRQALGYAIDYDGIINGLMAGAAIQPATIAAEPLPGTIEVQDKKYYTDIAKAQELFDAAGGGPLELTFSYGAGDIASGGLDLETLATKLQADLQQIQGLTIKLNPMDSAQRLEDYRASKLAFTVGPWTPDFPDIDAYAGPFGRSGTAAAKRVGYSNPDVDKLLDEGLAEQDPDKRAKIYAEVLTHIIEDAPFLILYQPVDQKPAAKAVQDVQTHSVYQLYLRNAYKSE